MEAVQGDALGQALRHWRAARGMSQIDLALAAEVSTKHISFLETGRAKPSREMVLILAGALDLPLRERNTLLDAAGYAAEYRETDLAAPEMAEVRRALELLLRQYEPFGGVVYDRGFDVLMANAAFLRFIGLAGLDTRGAAPYRLLPAPRLNGLEAIFRPEGLRRLITNWEEVGRAVLERVYGEILGDRDRGRRERFDAILALPGVGELWRRAPARPAALVIPVELAVGDLRVRLLSTITTLGTARDVTLQELRIESFHPADEESAEVARQLAAVSL
jgi:transcriptional regulator with XRE-family HTH domain